MFGLILDRKGPCSVRAFAEARGQFFSPKLKLIGRGSADQEICLREATLLILILSLIF